MNPRTRRRDRSACSPRSSRRRLVSVVVASTLVASGLAVLPAPVFNSITSYGAQRETLTFEPVSAVQAEEISSRASAPETVPPETTVPETTAPETTIASSAGKSVERFTTIGVSLLEAPQSPVLVRWRDGDGWSEWNELEVEPDKGPDPGTAEAAASAAHTGEVLTEPLWVGDADAYQVALDPADAVGGMAEVVLVRPSGTQLALEARSEPAGADAIGQPAIRPRSDWGARGPANQVNSASELKLAVVHHSATGNDYSQAEVPAVIRSIQAYHMDSNRWSDIGYNFIVDKFGGIWEGRDGSLNRNSIGAHAEGFNTSSVGVVALGQYSAASASGPQLNSIAEVISWKFASAGIDPNSRINFTSGGSSSIAAGQVVNLPRVVGHRDVGSTECPGSNLYSALGSQIRPLVNEKVAAKSSPIGIIDIMAGGPQSVLVSGWALDPLVTAPIEVHIYVDGVGRNLGPTPINRPDLAAQFPSSGTQHGYSTVISGLSPGSHSVCVFGINSGPGSNTLFECRTVTVKSGSPIGVVDAIGAGPDGVIGLSGWSYDPDLAGSNEVHVYVDAVGYNTGPAAQYRSDIASLEPGYGGSHGFGWASAGFSPGPHYVCVFAINSGPGSNSVLGCRTVVVPGGAPFGVLDQVVGGPDGTIGLWGWTIDPDTSRSNEAHVYIDGRGTNLGLAAVDRPDIATAFPGYGGRHGYQSYGTGYAVGPHDVCVFGVDTSGGASSLLRCQRVNVPGGSPSGSIDGVNAVSGRRVNVIGWAIDPDTAAAIEAHIYIDGVGYNAGLAAQWRPDVAAVVVGYGASHGLSWTSPVLAPGPHSVCTFAINRGAGANSLLDCRSVTV